MKSNNYAPSPDLAGIIARHYVFSVNLPDDYVIVDSLLAETAFIRVLIAGDWTGESAPGEWTGVGPMVFFGPNSRPYRVRVQGSFHVIGIAFCPGGWTSLFDAPCSDYTDRMLSLRDIWALTSDQMHQELTRLDHDDHQGAIAVIEATIRRLLNGRRRTEPDEAMRQFELIARHDSTILIRDAAAMVGLTARQLERRCKVAFGMSPKTVLRRSRFLDMASALRGLSAPSEEQLAELRYYDQSHLNREFRHFIGMTPGQFIATPTPLLTAGLELRILRKADDAASGSIGPPRRSIARPRPQVTAGEPVS